MTSQFLTLDDIIEQVRHRGNLAGYANRHGTQRLVDIWNASNQELREMVSTHDSSPYIKRTAPANLPTVAIVSGETYTSIDWPTDALSIHSVRVNQSNYWRPLKEVSPLALHDYQGTRGFTRRNGLPCVYALGRLPEGSGTTEVAGTIDIAPIPTEGQFTIWYTEAWTPLSDGNSVVNSVGAFLEWTIWDTIIKASAKDAKGGHTYAVAIMQRDRCQDRIQTRARRLSESAEINPRNARRDGVYWDWDLREDD